MYPEEFIDRKHEKNISKGRMDCLNLIFLPNGIDSSTSFDMKKLHVCFSRILLDKIRKYYLMLKQQNYKTDNLFH